MQRLKLKPQKIKQLAEGLRAIAKQDEPIRRVSGARFNATLTIITLQTDTHANGARTLCGILAMHRRRWQAHDNLLRILDPEGPELCEKASNTALCGPVLSGHFWLYQGFLTAHRLRLLSSRKSCSAKELTCLVGLDA